jgi:voltage-gated potassium channel
VSSAVAFTMAEEVDSFFDSLWWAAATITTVGYGDFSPVTVAGRIAGVFAMVVGITAFGLLTAQFAAFLSQNDD